jgi:hypothetical protein
MNSELAESLAKHLTSALPPEIIVSVVPAILEKLTAKEFLLASPDHFDYIIDALIKPAPNPTLRDVCAFWATVLTARKDLALKLHPQMTALANQLSDQPTK